MDFLAFIESAFITSDSFILRSLILRRSLSIRSVCASICPSRISVAFSVSSKFLKRLFSSDNSICRHLIFPGFLSGEYSFNFFSNLAHAVSKLLISSVASVRLPSLARMESVTESSFFLRSGDAI